jgi:predicted transcriptional regulator
MQRTTISLPDALEARLKREARRRGTSVSALVRESIEERLGKKPKEAARAIRWAGIAGDGEATAPRRTDERRVPECLDPLPDSARTSNRFSFIGLANRGGYPESDQVEEYLARYWMNDLLTDWGR